MGKTVKRAYKYRCYPTPEQAAELNRTFGCIRLVWNKALGARQWRYTTESKSTTYVQASADLTEWKKTEDLGFLREVSSVPLQQALRHQQAAFAAFFAKRAKYPKFKSRKKSQASAEYTRSGFRWRNGQLTLAKMTAPLDIRWSRPLPDGAEPSTATVSRDGAGRVKVARVHARITDRRTDHLHKLSTRLIRENQAIAIEDLAVRNMVKNRKLARAISDASWFQFRSMLEYKADWYGRDLLVVDRWYPSTRLCADCGTLRDKLALNIRAWVCRGCGSTHDRDINAARNILAAGLAER